MSSEEVLDEWAKFVAEAFRGQKGPALPRVETGTEGMTLGGEFKYAVRCMSRPLPLPDSLTCTKSLL